MEALASRAKLARSRGGFMYNRRDPGNPNWVARSKNQQTSRPLGMSTMDRQCLTPRKGEIMAHGGIVENIQYNMTIRRVAHSEAFNIRDPNDSFFVKGCLP